MNPAKIFAATALLLLLGLCVYRYWDIICDASLIVLCPNSNVLSPEC